MNENKDKDVRISELLDVVYDDELEDVTSETIDGKRIKNLTFSKLELDVAHLDDTTPRRTPKRILKVALIAAAIVLATATTAVGVNNALQLKNQPINYGRNLMIAGVPVQNPNVSNAAVDETVQSKGVSVTFDTVAADDNFVIAYFSLKFDKPIDLEGAVDDMYGGDPNRYDGYDKYKLETYLPPVSLIANGIELVSKNNSDTWKAADTYMPDERTIKFAVRHMAPTLLPDEFDLQANLLAKPSQGVKTPFLSKPVNFNISIDKTAVASKSKFAKPGLYTFQTSEGERYIDIEKFASSPLGTVLSVRRHQKDNGAPDTQYLDLDNEGGRAFSLFDDKGNKLGTFSNGMTGDGSTYSICEVQFSETTPGSDAVGDVRLSITSDDNIGAISIVPNVESLDNPSGMRTYSVKDIGVQIPVTASTGFFLEDYRVEGKKISIVTKPYGMNVAAEDFEWSHEFMPDDENKVTLTKERRSALRKDNYDSTTGLYTIEFDYYAATHKELLSIETFKVYFDGERVADTAAKKVFEFAVRK